MSIELEGAPEVWDWISVCLHHLWRFREFSTGRFLSVGHSMRKIVGAVLTGIDACIAYARAQPHTSDYYIHGYDNLGENERRYFF